MTHIICMLTAKNRDQLRNPTLGSRIWATFLHLMTLPMTLSAGHNHSKSSTSSVHLG